MEIGKANMTDLDEISGLYDAVCDYLDAHENYPGWKKGIYPTGEDAAAGIAEGSLYIAKENGAIAGTIILRHKPEEGYRNVVWPTESCYEKIYVVYTLAVHPDFLGRGVGKQLLDFAETLARREHCVSLRLDVVKGNLPAENLYKKCGYKYVGTTSLGYEAYGLPWFHLYEKVL